MNYGEFGELGRNQHRAFYVHMCIYKALTDKRFMVGPGSGYGLYFDDFPLRNAEICPIYAFSRNINQPSPYAEVLFHVVKLSLH
jgi:hypothetical protein